MYKIIIILLYMFIFFSCKEESTITKERLGKITFIEEIKQAGFLSDYYFVVILIDNNKRIIKLNKPQILIEGKILYEITRKNYFWPMYEVHDE